ncbi:MAG: hypothetical protein ACREMJ_04980 [Gemmatimonadales bacterium]
MTARRGRTWWPAVLAAVSAVPTLARTVPAQTRSWRGTARIDAEVRYDDNPFLLTPSKKRALGQVSPADALSGRYVDMESATDLVPLPAVELGLRGPGLGGRALEVSADVAYEANLENARRRHAELELTVAQSLRRDGRLRLNADWRPSSFHKNYLQDAVDLDADGDIAREERRYEAGMSREIEVSVGYRHRLMKATKRRPVGLAAEVELGYFDRAYDAPFEGRGRRGPGAGLDLSLDVGRRWRIGLELGYASESADPTPEVLILDENAFGVDFNANGAADDDSARAMVAVDRSRTEQRLGITLEGELSRAVTLEVAFGHRRRSFGSEQPYDVVNRDRRDRRNDLAAELDVRIASGLHVMLGARRAVQTTNRAGDPGSTGEETDYTRHVVSAGVRYRF